MLQYQGRKERRYIAPHKNEVKYKAQAASVILKYCHSVINIPSINLVLQVLSFALEWNLEKYEDHQAGRDSTNGCNPERQEGGEILKHYVSTRIKLYLKLENILDLSEKFSYQYHTSLK